MDWLSWVLERNTALRQAPPDRRTDHRTGLRIVDVDYRALVQDPIGQVARIHAAFGLPLTAAHERRMVEHLSAHPQRRFGPNPYAAEDYGQRTEAIAERFADYRSRFGLTS